MDIFVSGIPLSCTERDIKNTLKPYLLVVGIQHFELRVFTTKNGNRCGNLTVASAPDAEKFILKYGPQYGLPRRANPWSIFMGGRAINFQKSREAVDPFVLQRIRRAEKQSISGSKIFTKPSDDRSNTIMIESIECGFFDYPQSGQLVFHNCHKQYRSGSLVFGRKRLLIILNETKDNANRTRIQIEYASIYSISGHSRKNSNFVINVMNPPMFYQDTMANDSIEDDVSSAFGRLGLVTMEPQTSRSCHLGGSHAAAVGSCPTYWINFKGPGDFKNALKRLREERSAPKPLHQEIPIYRKDFNFSQEMMLLNNILADSVDVPFAVKFQLQMLAQNGILNPQKVRRLRDPVAEMLQELDTVQVAEGIRALKNVLDFAGPNCNGDSFTLEALVKLIKQRALNYPLRNSMYRTARRHDHLALVYKAYVSPASIWLGGPELETKNRVLRKYPNNLDYFIRVNFCDEDGEQVRYEYKVNRDAIFKQRFADFLNNGKLIAGRQFGFLGFSHSSLRSQTCWFVSPFVLSGSLLLAKHLIRDLGDFSRIYSPAKCAARIGQAFSDAADSVAFAEEELECIPDIEREGRCFTDGVGTISFSLLRRVWRRFSRNKKAYAPILQVRFQGCKGLLALDNTIDRNLIRYRDSMNKFPAPKHLELEITGASYKPLTMYLNRQFIKILEDLGADTASFLKLQTQVLADIEKTVESPLDTAKYLDNNLFGTGVGLSSLIRSLYQAGFHFKDDVFLRQVVEIATRVQLRELKHKARIPVPDAHLLYGVVDETGFLKPNEVHVILKEKRGRQTTRIGDVLITRAPAMHPGDFQFVTAVDVPRESQNEKLYNCVIFSQHGSRDIPSMLSGGDLDGDLFNVIFDSSLFPKHTCDPADYPRPQAIDIGREVTTKDMSKFFLEFMEQDKLGYICNTHMIIADQKPEGVFDQNCITLAEMASTAVDFSKTGIPVDMERFPHNSYNKNRRPDFMAQTPHLILNSSEASLEADDDEMIYHGTLNHIYVLSSIIICFMSLLSSFTSYCFR